MAENDETCEVCDHAHVGGACYEWCGCVGFWRRGARRCENPNCYGCKDLDVASPSQKETRDHGPNNERT